MVFLYIINPDYEEHGPGILNPLRKSLWSFDRHFPTTRIIFPIRFICRKTRDFSLFLKRNKKIICLFEDHFVLLEMQQMKSKQSSHKFSDLLYLEHGKILLHSWLNIVSAIYTISLRFNTTNDYLFKPIINKMRQGMSDVHANDRNLRRSRRTNEVTQIRSPQLS